MFERFHFKRLGGSVFRYNGIESDEGDYFEDWLNHVAPAIMFFRSFILSKGITLKFFTIDASSVSMLDHSDPSALYGASLENGSNLSLAQPTNPQSSEKVIRDFIDAAMTASNS
jgi:hypothetical protein